MTVVCLILITIANWQGTASVKGRVLGENQSHYLVDFSKEATEKKYEGDYSKIFARKDECVRVK